MKEISKAIGALFFSFLLSEASAEDKAPNVQIPIFSQKVSFDMPQGMKPAFQSPPGPSFIMEFVPKEENVKSWTSLFQITGVKKLASVMGVKKASEIEGNSVRKACPEDFIERPLNIKLSQNYETYSVIMGCKKSLVLPDGTSEVAAYVYIKGKEEIYFLKKAFRSVPGKIDLNDETVKKLAPELYTIALCKNKGQSPVCEKEDA